jgi:hypothetical protein
MLSPCVDLDEDGPSTKVRGMPEWLRCTGLVHGTLEAHGCVDVKCHRGVPPELRERMLAAMAELFKLLAKTKQHTGDTDSLYKAYMGKRDSAACWHEAFEVLNAAVGGGEEPRAFVTRVWPYGNEYCNSFREVQGIVRWYFSFFF